MEPLDHLPGLASGALWRADTLACADGRVRPSGHAALDRQLPGGGWPDGCLIELLLDAPGQGEWRLLATALAATAGPWLAIGAPLQPHAPALQALGLDLAQGLWIAPRHDLDAAWAAEQALRAGPCAAVLCWTAETEAPLPLTALRRLHLAAQGRRALLFLLRPSHRVPGHAATPAALRLHGRVDPVDPARLQLRILKRRGPPLADTVTLDTRAQLAPALAHRLSLPLPQHRPMPDTTAPTRPASAPAARAPQVGGATRSEAPFALDTRVAALLARVRQASDPAIDPTGPQP
jgi:protein ImuA